jgi:LemA protein
MQLQNVLERILLSGRQRRNNGMSRGLGILLGIVGVFVLIALLIFGSFKSAQNQMVQKDEQVKASWSQVDVQLQRRADLIPNLVETVKGFTKEESTVFGDIANARAGLLNAHDPKSKIAANGQLDSAFGRLLALTDNYPQLRSSDQFMRLQVELSGTENRIGVARRRYNDTLRDYNTYVREFPNSIWAGILGFHVNDAYFEASAASRTAPAVKF